VSTLTVLSEHASWGGVQGFYRHDSTAIGLPSTSPRNTGIEGADASWDFGTAAGFYLDAVRPRILYLDINFLFTPHKFDPATHFDVTTQF